MIKAADIETFVRENSSYPEDYTFLCGKEFFALVAKYINDGWLDIATLKRCMHHDTRIFDNKPYDRSGFKFISPSPRQRLVMLKKSHMVLSSTTKKDPILLLEGRIRKLESIVKLLQDNNEEA